MELAALFTIALSVNFSARFQINNKTYQDFVIFDGVLSNAHLFRENKTISLSYTHQNSVSVYQKNSTSSVIQFEWPMLINHERMQLVRGGGDISTPQFNSFTLFDPILDSQPDDVTGCLDSDGALHNYLISAVIVLLMIIESPGIITKLINKYQTRISATLYSVGSSETV